MISEAGAFWNAIKDKVRALCREMMGKALQCERYDVTTAPNGSVIGVRQPFGSTEIFIPYSGEVADAAAGDTVLVYWWGSLSNAKAWCYGNGPSLSGGSVDYPISVANGGTGATTAAGALTNLGGVSITKLWENASPGSAFAAQTVPLALSGFGYVLIVPSYDKNPGIQSPLLLPVGVGGNYLTVVSGYTGSPGYIVAERRVGATASGVAFTDVSNYQANTTGTGGVYNERCIPVLIFGIKGVT